MNSRNTILIKGAAKSTQRKKRKRDDVNNVKNSISNARRQGHSGYSFKQIIKYG